MNCRGCAVETGFVWEQSCRQMAGHGTPPQPGALSGWEAQCLAGPHLSQGSEGGSSLPPPAPALASSAPRLKLHPSPLPILTRLSVRCPSLCPKPSPFS